MLPMAQALLAVLILYSRNVTSYLFLNGLPCCYLLSFSIFFMFSTKCAVMGSADLLDVAAVRLPNQYVALP